MSDIQFVANISNSTSDTIVVGTAGADSIHNEAENVTIQALSGNDTIETFRNKVIVYGGNGNDTIYNNYKESAYSVIDSNYVTISGDSGDDYLCNGYRENNTPSGVYYGTDNASSSDMVNSIIIDNDSISPYSPYRPYRPTDTLNLTLPNSIYSTSSRGNYVMMLGGDGNDTVISNAGNNVTLNGGAGDDSLIGSSSNDKEIFVYNSGNDTIQNYNSNDRLIFDATYTGWTTNDYDLMIYAAEGSVRIQNANYKWVELADVNGNVVAHVHLAGVNEDSIDGRSYDGFEVISGSNIANQIYAGSGGSSLYGGLGGNDELYGNVGYDEFVYCYGDGQDSIFNASAEDAINLNGVNLEQLTTAEITDGGVNLGFADGGALNINGQVGTFILSGQRFGADYQNKSWYAK